MRPTSVQNHVPKVPEDQLTRDRMLKRLRKLRWIGQELEAQKMLQVLTKRAQALASTRSAQTEPLRWDRFPGNFSGLS
jgi:hypothetical protein